jgi:MFS family permease
VNPLKQFLGWFYTYTMCFNFFAWLPIFYLFMNSRVSTSQVLQLEAIYYAAVVVSEIPCGYLSDRLGRWQTLAAAMIGLVVAYSCFWLSDTGSFSSLAIAQAMLGFSFALNSGTDTAILYETFADQEKADEYPDAEARFAQLGLLSTGLAVIAGGLISTIELKYAYGLSAIAAAIGCTSAFKMRNFLPKVTHASDSSAYDHVSQFKQIFSLFQKPIVRVLFLFTITMTVLNHVPYEFAQPYLRLWVENTDLQDNLTTVSGVVTALGLFLGAYLARPLILRLQSSTLGLVTTGLMLATIGIIGFLSFTVNIFGVFLICIRTIFASASRSIGNIWLGPHLPNRLRATFLSTQSLTGRLMFSLTLVGMSQVSSSHVTSFPDLQTILSIFAFSALFFVMGIFVPILFLEKKRGQSS